MRIRLEPLDETNLVSALRATLEAVDASPHPKGEWPPVRDIVGDELLSRLLGVSDSSLRRYAAGDRRNGDRLTLEESTVRGNAATSSSGGGISNFGGAVILKNSTVSGNAANGGGGIFNQPGTLSLEDSTVSDNTASRVGGILNSGAAKLDLESLEAHGDSIPGPIEVERLTVSA